jgi:hypothetical protein
MWAIVGGAERFAYVRVKVPVCGADIEKRECCRLGVYCRGPGCGTWITRDLACRGRDESYIETYNQTAKPFKWTYTGKTLEA